MNFPTSIYRNHNDNSDSRGTAASLELKSSQMTLDLMREANTDSSSDSKTLVKQIEALQNVRVGYNNEHLLVADHALYQRLPNSESSVLSGLLTLSVRGIHPFCQLTNVNGDCLQAKTIQVNTIERKLWLSEPEGKLKMAQEKNCPQTLELKANELSWDHQKQILHLKGEVAISQNENLHISTIHEISIAQGTVEGKRSLRSIHSPAETRITYVDDSKGREHHIYCPGTFEIDHLQHIMTLRGLTDESELQNEQSQVYIEDVLGEMYADLVSIDYRWEEGRFLPKKVILEGHVKLMNRFDGHVEEVGSVLHNALADRVEYSPEEHEMVLSASDGNRVLFYDKVNNVQMSAPSLKVVQDPSSDKEIIKGQGDVRFTFLEKELAQFKQHFKQKDSSLEGMLHDQ